MKKSVKIIAVFCIFAAVLSVFAGCESGKENPQNTDTEGVSEVTSAANLPVIEGEFETKTLEEPILLISGTTTNYKLIRADNTSDDVISCYQQVMRTMKSSGIIMYTGATDWVKPGTDVSAEKELLLGNTNREESAAVMAKLGYNDFAITLLNNKIVVAANNRAKLLEAVNYLCTNLIEFKEENGKKCAYLTGTYYSHDDKASVLGTDGKLEDYSIVYVTGSKMAKDNAETLQAAVKKVFGVELEVKSEVNAKSGREIVVGLSSRPICEKYKSEIDYNSFVIAADNGDIVIMGEDNYTTEKAVEVFSANYLNKYYSNTLSMSADFKYKRAAYVFADDPARADGTDIRIMSYNLLCELWDEAATIPGRDVRNAIIIKTYAPDVAGIQEVSDKWYTALNSLIGDEYAFTDKKNTLNQTNFSTLIYNRKTVKLLDHGVKVFSLGNDTRLRLATWGYFEHIATGKKFIAVSTHWDLGKNAAFQMIHSNEMAQLVLDLGKKYNCEVITTGDYNSLPTSDPYINFVSLTNYADAKYAAKVVHNPCKGTHTLYSTIGSAEGNSIDHIFGSAGVEFLYYNCLIDKMVCDSSDHNPIYADIKLK